MKFSVFPAALAFGALLTAGPALGESGSSNDTVQGPADRQGSTVYDGDWVSIGAGVGYGPSYSGSDDYVAFPVPLIQGSLGGVAIRPRAGGVALDFIPDPDKGAGFALGPVLRIRSDRARQIEDPVVASAGKLKTAIEIGGNAGVSMPAVLNPYDRLSFSVDVTHDINGAHRGTAISPGISYFTPLSRGMIAMLSVSAEHGDRKFMDYYYSVSPTQSAASGLPTYTAGSGWTKAGANLIVGVDLDGDLTNGGLGLVFIGGYSHMLGDAKDTPYTSIRGSADQWLGGVGIGYTF
ncbi:MipA/OmpV family protein [Tsuneonella suprasediminis]|uniref:MipA/OmpV family protein n=1 Tax=Tsuneonella suprasediminis TaxID=2306996 RepID=UPI002F943EE6